MTHLRRICACCVSDGVPRRSLAVAFVVGAILNLINQGDALVGGAPLDWAKIALTFLVPYCVATYGAASYRLRAGTGSADPPFPGQPEAGPADETAAPGPPPSSMSANRACFETRPSGAPQHEVSR